MMTLLGEQGLASAKSWSGLGWRSSILWSDSKGQHQRRFYGKAPSTAGDQNLDFWDAQFDELSFVCWYPIDFLIEITMVPSLSCYHWQVKALDELFTCCTSWAQNSLWIRPCTAMMTPTEDRLGRGIDTGMMCHSNAYLDQTAPFWVGASRVDILRIASPVPSNQHDG